MCACRSYITYMHAYMTYIHAYIPYIHTYIHAYIHTRAGARGAEGLPKIRSSILEVGAHSLRKYASQLVYMRVCKKACIRIFACMHVDVCA
jgi:hypothetical protein